jgi:hypothetical protein
MDGDNYSIVRHRDFFNQWYQVWHNEENTGNLLAAINFVRRAARAPISDPLHLWKGFRNHLLGRFLPLDSSSVLNVLRAHEMESNLRVGEALTDKSRIGCMGDVHPLKRFTLENALNCIQNDKNHEMLYIMPWAFHGTVL